MTGPNGIEGFWSGIFPANEAGGYLRAANVLNLQRSTVEAGNLFETTMGRIITVAKGSKGIKIIFDSLKDKYDFKDECVRQNLSL